MTVSLNALVSSQQEWQFECCTTCGPALKSFNGGDLGTLNPAGVNMFVTTFL